MSIIHAVDKDVKETFSRFSNLPEIQALIAISRYNQPLPDFSQTGWNQVLQDRLIAYHYQVRKDALDTLARSFPRRNNYIRLRVQAQQGARFSHGVVEKHLGGRSPIKPKEIEGIINSIVERELSNTKTE